MNNIFLPLIRKMFMNGYIWFQRNYKNDNYSVIVVLNPTCARGQCIKEAQY